MRSPPAAPTAVCHGKVFAQFGVPGGLMRLVVYDLIFVDRELLSPVIGSLYPPRQFDDTERIGKSAFQWLGGGLDAA